MYTQFRFHRLAVTLLASLVCLWTARMQAVTLDRLELGMDASAARYRARSGVIVLGNPVSKILWSPAARFEAFPSNLMDFSRILEKTQGLPPLQEETITRPVPQMGDLFKSITHPAMRQTLDDAELQYRQLRTATKVSIWRTISIPNEVVITLFEDGTLEMRRPNAQERQATQKSKQGD